MICKVCGHNIQETNKFCSYCGTPVETEEEHQAAEIVPEERFETIKVQSVEEQNRNESPAEEDTVPFEEPKTVISDEKTGEWKETPQGEFSSQTTQEESRWENHTASNPSSESTVGTKSPGTGFFGFLGNLGAAFEPFFQKMLQIKNIWLYIFLGLVVLDGFGAFFIGGMFGALTGSRFGALGGSFGGFIVAALGLGLGYLIYKAILRSACNKAGVMIYDKEFKLRALISVAIVWLGQKIGYGHFLPGIIMLLVEISLITAIFSPVTPEGNEGKFFKRLLIIQLIIFLILFLIAVGITACSVFLMTAFH